MKEDRLTLKELIWLFVLGCFFGFLLETIWYFFKHGVIINKQGLLYGPFKPIYGFGLIIIVLVMNKYKDARLWQKFILGVLVGSAFEYFGSLFQEYVFSTSTWNYASFKLSLGSRLYLPYCLIWGVLAILVIDIFYPTIKKIIRVIPPRIYTFSSYVVLILMVVNIFLTMTATLRYSARINKKGETNIFWRIIDEAYNDEYMKRKFPKMRVIKKD